MFYFWFSTIDRKPSCSRNGISSCCCGDNSGSRGRGSGSRGSGGSRGSRGGGGSGSRGSGVNIMLTF